MLPPCRNSLSLHTQWANWASNLIKSANTAIVQEPPLQDCGWDRSGNSIWADEHFPEKIADVVHNEYQGSDDVIGNEDFN